MSEKRFEVIFYGDVINCVRDENGKEYNLHETITILNEQQANINKLKSDIEETEISIKLFEDDVNRLSKENEQLRKQCFELEKDYLIETSDISDKIYLKDEIKELKQRYGVGDE